MKKIGAISLAVLMALSLLSGCGKKDVSIESGTWYDTTTKFNYVFYTDGESGQLVNPVSDTGLPFNYDVDGDKITFHFGSVDDNTPATVEMQDEATCRIIWEDGSSDVLMFIDSSTEDDFAYDFIGGTVTADEG